MIWWQRLGRQFLGTRYFQRLQTTKFLKAFKKLFQESSVVVLQNLGQKSNRLLELLPSHSWVWSFYKEFQRFQVIRRNLLKKLQSSFVCWKSFQERAFRNSEDFYLFDENLVSFEVSKHANNTQYWPQSTITLFRY